MYNMTYKIQTPRCSDCNLFCGWAADNGTHFGCNDPEDPEPLDPDYFCSKCAEKEYTMLLTKLKARSEGKIDMPWWIQPSWYDRAIKDSGYEIVRTSVGNYQLNTKRY